MNIVDCGFIPSSYKGYWPNVFLGDERRWLPPQPESEASGSWTDCSCSSLTGTASSQAAFWPIGRVLLGAPGIATRSKELGLLAVLLGALLLLVTRSY